MVFGVLAEVSAPALYVINIRLFVADTDRQKVTSGILPHGVHVNFTIFLDRRYTFTEEYGLELTRVLPALL